MKNHIISEIQKTRATVDRVLQDQDLLETLENVAKQCLKTLDNGGKILLAGNGGSAADAQHLAAELVSRFKYDRPGLAAIALTTDTSALTAIGNDYGYERVFERQVEALGRQGDVFIGISTSGNSPNILKALAAAKARGLLTVGLTGETGGKMVDLCDDMLRIPSQDTPKIQECHIMLGHILCDLIEQTLYPKKEVDLAS